MIVQLIYYKGYYINVEKISLIFVSKSSINNKDQMDIRTIDQSTILYPNLAAGFVTTYTTAVNDGLALLNGADYQPLAYYDPNYFQPEKIVYIRKDTSSANNNKITLSVRFNDQTEWIIPNLTNDDVTDFFDSGSFNITEV